MRESEKMFETGAYVVYGNTGICRVMGVTTMDMAGIPKDKLYYILRPDGQTEGKIFTPVENRKQIMRSVMSKVEAEELIECIPDIEALDVADDKQREEQYRECIKSCECKEMIRIIKTIYLRKKEREAQGKKVTATDEKYLKMAEENLYSELAMLLGVPKNRMENYITVRLKRKQEV